MLQVWEELRWQLNFWHREQQTYELMDADPCGHRVVVSITPDCLAEETGKTVLEVLETATLVWQEKRYGLKSDCLVGELFGRMDSVVDAAEK
ncbi:hypothetical protein ACFX2F_029036 [Malus domestica]